MAQTEDQLWSQYQSQKPTEDQLWDQYQGAEQQRQPTAIAAGMPYGASVSGALADAAYGVGAAGRVLKAAGQGAADEWGAMKGTTGQQLYESLDPEDAKADKAIVKSGNEGWLRPMAAKIAAQETSNVINAVTNTVKPLFAGVAGAMAGIQQLGEELPRPAGELLEEAPGALPTLHVPEGGLKPEEAPTVDLRPWMNTVQRLQTARAKGVIGPEGERGFFGLSEITPEEKSARLEAAQEAGTQAVIETGQPPTLDDLAQRVNPEAFQQRSDLQEQLSLIQRSRSILAEQKEELPEVQSLRAKEVQILDSVNGNEEELSDAKADDLSATRSQIDDLVNKTTPEEDELNQSHLDTLSKLNEIQPYINEAYIHANRLLPKESTPEKGQPSTAPQEAQELEASGRVAPGSSDTGTGPGGPSKGFKSLSGAATPEELKTQIDKELSESGELAGVPALDKKDQISKASDLVMNSPQDALDVVNGNIEIPGVHPQVVLRALSVKAMAEQNLDLARALERSKANRDASAAGQTLSMRSGIAGDVNPVDLIGDAETSRRANKAGGMRQADAAVKTTAKGIQDSVERTLSRFSTDWDSLVSSIACDY